MGDMYVLSFPHLASGTRLLTGLLGDLWPQCVEGSFYFE